MKITLETLTQEFRYMQQLELNPQKSTRGIGRELDISAAAVLKFDININIVLIKL